MAESFTQLPPDGTGKKLHTRSRTIGANSVEEQYVIPTTEEVVSFRSRTSTFRIPGRAGTANQALLSLHNASATTLVCLEAIAIDLVQTVVKAVTVLPPIIRIYRTTAAPTGGSALTKTAVDSNQTSDGSVTLLQDASADGTLSATALSQPANAGIVTQEFAPRLITAAGYEPADRVELLGEFGPVLRNGQGAQVRLDYNLATMNPATDMWIVTARFSEYTLP